MRIFLVLLLSLPCLIHASCGCEEVRETLERGRKADAAYHGCRSCKALPEEAISVDACPPFGYECNADWPMTTNVLTASGNRQCSELQCSGNAKLAFEQRIKIKARCNNSQWMIGGTEADVVVCAKSCNTRDCKAYHPKPFNSLIRLKVTPATATTAHTCAIARCEANQQMVALKDDGSVLNELDDSITTIICSGDGKWWYGEGESSKYVMCYPSDGSACGSSKCPRSVSNAVGDVSELTVVENGKECATATCKGGFVSLTANGEIDFPLTGVSSLTCREDGKWTAAGTVRERVMCRGKPCKSCGRSLITVNTDGAGGKAMDEDTVDWTGATCAVRTFKCKGERATIEINNRDGVVKDEDDGVDGVATFRVKCNDEGTGWVSDRFGVDVTKVECSVVAATTPGLP